MDANRKGQIALLIIKHQLGEKGVQLTSNFRRRIGNLAAQIGVSTNEAMEFAQEIITEMMNEAFAKSEQKK